MTNQKNDPSLLEHAEYLFVEATILLFGIYVFMAFFYDLALTMPGYIKYAEVLQVRLTSTEKAFLLLCGNFNVWWVFTYPLTAIGFFSLIGYYYRRVKMHLANPKNNEFHVCTMMGAIALNIFLYSTHTVFYYLVFFRFASLNQGIS